MLREDYVTDSLKELNRQCKNISGERDAEFLIYNLFINNLNWNKDKVHKQKKTDSGIPDITVIDKNGTHIFVEVKQPKEFKTELQINKAIKQLLNYMKCKESSYGVVTDSIRWIFIQYKYVEDTAYKIHYLDLSKAKLFKRCVLTFKLLDEISINELMEVLSHINGGLNEKDFNQIMNDGNSVRINKLMSRYYDSAIKPDTGIKALIADIYKGGTSPVRYLYKLGMGKAIKF